MTTEEQSLADDKMRAEIAKMGAEVAHLMAATAKINKENRWYLLIIGSGATLAIVAIAKLFI